MSADYFAAPLHCAHCGAPLAGGAPTQIRLRPRGDEIRAGDVVGEIPHDPAAAGYAAASERATGEPLRLLEAWECANCGRANFAVVEIDDGVMSSMRAVELDDAVLEDVHWVSLDLGVGNEPARPVPDSVLHHLGRILRGQR